MIMFSFQSSRRSLLIDTLLISYFPFESYFCVHLINFLSLFLGKWASYGMLFSWRCEGSFLGMSTSPSYSHGFAVRSNTIRHQVLLVVSCQSTMHGAKL